MKNKVLISILLIFIMLTVQYCDASIIIDIISIILYLLFGPPHASKEGVHVDPPVPHATQTSTFYCSAACTEMIGKWDGWKVPYTPTQTDIMNWADDPQNGGDNDGILSVLEIVNAVKHFAYNTCFYKTFTAASGYNKSIDDALSLSMLQIGEDNVPNIMSVDWLSNYNASHAILIQGYDGKELNSGGVAKIQTADINDPALANRNNAYAILDLRDRMEEYWWNAPGGRYCLGYFLEPIDTATSQAVYYEYLRNCGTYYGGPEIYIPEGTDFLRVRSPNGGNTLAINRSDQIIWESVGLSGNIRLELYKNGSLIGTIADDLPIGNGSYNWTVGEYQGGSAGTGEGYMIKISMMDDSHEDCSNVNFSIGDMNVTSPNGGEAWDQGSIRYITWDNSYFSGDVHLYLRKTIPGTDYLIEENVKNTGIYEWIVGMCTRNGERGIIEPGDCYKIKVVSVDNPDLKSSSNQTFEITEPLPPGITVTSPNGGENIVGGSTLEITWTWTGNVENVKIEFSTNNGTSWQFIVESTENDGFYTYNVPIPNAQKDNCLVRISEIDGDPSDVSDAVFSVVLPPSITVLSPNGGEEWQMDSVHNITWNASGLSNNLNIALQQNGISVALIAENIDPGLGSYAWTVGQFIQGTASAGSGYMIKIKEIGEAVSDTSDANFSLIE